jgi:hypothetical protein
VPLPKRAVLWGWFNEDHLMAYDDGQVTVIDGTGRPVRALAEINADDKSFWEVHFTRNA